MASVHDVAKYILRQKGELDTWRFQKLVYYSQAWHTVWEDEPLFSARIEAWSNGPVAPALYALHRREYRVDRWALGSISNLTRAERDSIDVVLEHYGGYTGFALRELTHRERPWREARKGLPLGAPSNRIITPESMAEYYGSL